MSRGWYIIRTRSEYEKKVKQAIDKTVENLGLGSRIFQVVVPHEEVVELRRNKKYVKTRPFFTGYVFIDMDLDQDTYWVVKNTSGVSGFLGGTAPIPMPEDEVKNLITVMESPMQVKPAITFEKDETVRIIDGPFAHFMGVVEEINEEKGKLKVMVTIFGRSTPVELNFFQVEKI
ncbi:MAG: transcription termination/antitermination factor NusG [Elusimicrobia bacterium RIFOXYA2_FULL_39_19]|nr:MAG: transcription termination/antitermination factor NusG [Elusimicrobia bacterium RIFOXYA2_FULL_39_19]